MSQSDRGTMWVFLIPCPHFFWGVAIWLHRECGEVKGQTIGLVENEPGRE